MNITSSVPLVLYHVEFTRTVACALIDPLTACAESVDLDAHLCCRIHERERRDGDAVWSLVKVGFGIEREDREREKGVCGGVALRRGHT